MKKFLASMVLVISLVAFTFPAFASTFTPRVITSTAEPTESGSKFGEGECVSYEKCGEILKGTREEIDAHIAGCDGDGIGAHVFTVDN